MPSEFCKKQQKKIFKLEFYIKIIGLNKDIFRHVRSQKITSHVLILRKPLKDIIPQ